MALCVKVVNKEDDQGDFNVGMLTVIVRDENKEFENQ